MESRNPGQSGSPIQTGQGSPTLTHLERRAIQAPLVVKLISRFSAEFGKDRAMELASEVIEADAAGSGKILAETFGGNDMKVLKRILQEVWAQDNALEYQILEESEHRLSFTVNRCLYMEMYDRLGCREFGYCLSCSRDAAFLKGFNPQITLTRTRTIMEGAEVCDFRFDLRSDNEPSLPVSQG